MPQAVLLVRPSKSPLLKGKRRMLDKKNQREQLLLKIVKKE